MAVLRIVTGERERRVGQQSVELLREVLAALAALPYDPERDATARGRPFPFWASFRRVEALPDPPRSQLEVARRHLLRARRIALDLAAAGSLNGGAFADFDRVVELADLAMSGEGAWTTLHRQIVILAEYTRIYDVHGWWAADPPGVLQLAPLLGFSWERDVAPLLRDGTLSGDELLALFDRLARPPFPNVVRSLVDDHRDAVCDALGLPPHGPHSNSTVTSVAVGVLHRRFWALHRVVDRAYIYQHKVAVLL